MTDRSKEDISRIVKAELGVLMQGTSEDLDEFANEIAVEAVIAASAGDEATISHLKAQVRMIAGRHRLKASASGWRILETGIGILVRSLVAVVAVMLLLVSCVTPGQLVAADIKPAVDIITAEYDKALDGELDLGGLSEMQKRARRRSTELLRGLVDAAVAQGESSSPEADPADPGSR